MIMRMITSGNIPNIPNIQIYIEPPEEYIGRIKVQLQGGGIFVLFEIDKKDALQLSALLERAAHAPRHKDVSARIRSWYEEKETRKAFAAAFEL